MGWPTQSRTTSPRRVRSSVRPRLSEALPPPPMEPTTTTSRSRTLARPPWELAPPLVLAPTLWPRTPRAQSPADSTLQRPSTAGSCRGFLGEGRSSRRTTTAFPRRTVSWRPLEIVGGAGELFNSSKMEQWGDKIAENNQGPVPGRYYAPNPMAKTGRKLQTAEVNPSEARDPEAGGIDFGLFIDNDAEAVEKDAIHDLVPTTKEGPLIDLKAAVQNTAHANATLPISLPSFGRKLLFAN